MEGHDIDREEEEWAHLSEQQFEPISENQIDWIEQLLKYSNVDHDKRLSLELGLKSRTRLEAEELIGWLLDNQLEPIASGRNYGATEIVNKIKREIR
jgi:hypothetical protein